MTSFIETQSYFAELLQTEDPTGLPRVRFENEQWNYGCYDTSSHAETFVDGVSSFPAKYLRI